MDEHLDYIRGFGDNSELFFEKLSRLVILSFLLSSCSLTTEYNVVDEKVVEQIEIFATQAKEQYHYPQQNGIVVNIFERNPGVLLSCDYMSHSSKRSSNDSFSNRMNIGTKEIGGLCVAFVDHTGSFVKNPKRLCSAINSESSGNSEIPKIEEFYSREWFFVEGNILSPEQYDSRY